MTQYADIAIIGAGAAGLFAAIWAGQTLRDAGSNARIVAVDGAKKLGAKILVAGGGRCNVTHHTVDESAYAGSSKHAIKQVLRSFDVDQTVAFFEQWGVVLKREETGKLFPTTDDAYTVLSALLRACDAAAVRLLHPWRVQHVRTLDDGLFEIHRSSEAQPDSPPEILKARRLILSTGGMALPRSGSDGLGYSFAKALGHSITPAVFPALVPLILGESGTFLKELSGLTLPATIELQSSSGKKLKSFTNSTLCTHFGLSGPGVLDISRYYTEARKQDAGATMSMNFTPGRTVEQIEQHLTEPGKLSVLRRVQELVPERLARALCLSLGIDPQLQAAHLKKDDRRALARQITHCPLPITGDRGFTHAEVTAGGVPLSEIHLSTMESRICPGLYICGEICDVDGRIGGFNFQWAWASGYIAGTSSAQATLLPSRHPA